VVVLVSSFLVRRTGASDEAPALAALAAWLASRSLRAPRAPRGAAASDPPCPTLPLTVPLPGDGPLPAPLAAALDAVAALLAASVNATSVPGAALSVAYRGATLLNTSAGVARKPAAQAAAAAAASAPPPAPPSTSETLWRIASVSKLFPALLLQLLADADGGGARSGALRLDDAIADFAPAFAPVNPYDASRPTFAQLAAHTSGLQREAPFGANSTADALAALSAPEAPLILPPGTRPSYSNLGFAVLGHVLAEFVAQPPASLPELVAEQVLAPLGLASTGYDYGAPGVAGRLADGYDAAGDAVPFADLGWWFPAGSMFASVDDLSRLATGVLAAAAANGSSLPSGGLALSAGAARGFLQPRFRNRDGLSLVGAPWETRIVAASAAAGAAGLQALCKGGNLPGYTALLALVPELELSVAAAWNGGVDEFAFADAALAALVPPLVAALGALAPVPPYDPSPSPADYEGTYALGGTEVVVRLESGLLLWYCSAIGAQVILDHLGGDLFRAAFPDSAFPCLLGELEGLRFQVVAFGRNTGGGGGGVKGAVTTTQMAGFIPGAIWTRVAAAAAA